MFSRFYLRERLPVHRKGTGFRVRATKSSIGSCRELLQQKGCSGWEGLPNGLRKLFDDVLDLGRRQVRVHRKRQDALG